MALCRLGLNSPKALLRRLSQLSRRQPPNQLSSGSGDGYIRSLNEFLPFSHFTCAQRRQPGGPENVRSARVRLLVLEIYQTRQPGGSQY